MITSKVCCAETGRCSHTHTHTHAHTRTHTCHTYTHISTHARPRLTLQARLCTDKLRKKCVCVCVCLCVCVCAQKPRLTVDVSVAGETRVEVDGVLRPVVAPGTNTTVSVNVSRAGAPVSDAEVTILAGACKTWLSHTTQHHTLPLYRAASLSIARRCGNCLAGTCNAWQSPCTPNTACNRLTKLLLLRHMCLCHITHHVSLWL